MHIWTFLNIFSLKNLVKRKFGFIKTTKTSFYWGHANERKKKYPKKKFLETAFRFWQIHRYSANHAFC